MLKEDCWKSEELHSNNDIQKQINWYYFSEWNRYDYVPDGQVEELLKKQDSFTWFKNYLFNHKGNKEKTIQTKASYDEKKLKTVLYEKKQLKDENQVAPTDARLKYENQTFTVVKEKTWTYFK